MRNKRRRKNKKKEVIGKKSQERFGVGVRGCIVCFNTVSSQCPVSFQAFVAAPTMKCVCPQKPYTHSGGFPDLRDREEEKEQAKECSSLPDEPARKEGDPGKTAHSLGCTHSKALAKAAEFG